MKILLTISFLFSVATAQIKADGIADDLPSLKALQNANIVTGKQIGRAHV